MSERTSRQGITHVAKALFEQGAAERVVVAGMPKLRAAMHLDTVFTFADRDLVTYFPGIVDQIHTFSLRPSDAAPGRRMVCLRVVVTALGHVTGGGGNAGFASR